MILEDSALSETRVKAPDGSFITVEHPEGATDAQILDFARQNYEPTVSDIPKGPTGPGMRPLATPFGILPVGDPLGGLAGFADFLLDGVAGFAGGATGGLAALSGADIETSNRVLENTSASVAGLFDPESRTAQQVSSSLARPFVAADEAAQRAGEVSDSPAVSTAIKTTLLGVPALLAGARGSRGRSFTTKQQTALAAQEAGYQLPPGSSGGVGVQAVEGLVGRPKIRMEAAQENVAVHNRLANKALDLPEDVPLSVSVLEQLRRDAGAAYAIIDDAGTIVSDITHRRGVSDAVSSIKKTSKDFPSVANAEGLVDQLLSIAGDMQKVNSFSAKSARGLIELMRDNADKAFRDGQSSVGRSYRKLSEVMENTVDRYLERTGSPDTVRAYRDARQRIAKSYSVQEALDGDGIVLPSKLKQQLKRGVPLTDELLLIAKVNEQFPQSTAVTATIKEGASPFSVFDSAITLGAAGAAFANPAMIPLAAFAAGRPLIRRGLLSGPGQRLATPNTVTHPAAVPGLLASAELAEQ